MAVNYLDVITGREEITVDYAAGTVEMVKQHDGSVLRLRKLANDYDVHDRIAAMTYLQQRHAAGEIVTGLLYVDPDPRTCIRHMNTVTDAVQRSGRGGAVPGFGGAGEAQCKSAIASSPSWPGLTRAINGRFGSSSRRIHHAEDHAPRRSRRIGCGAICRARHHSRAEHVETLRIGLLSDMGGPYRDVGGPGNRLAVELAVAGLRRLGARPARSRCCRAMTRTSPTYRSSLAREWIDSQGVDALADGAASSAGLAIQQVCREKKRIYLITGPATSDMTGKQCSPYGIHFAYDTYALAHGTGNALTKAGGDTWFFITADYAFGYALERDTIAAVQAAGGKVLGSGKSAAGNSGFLHLPGAGEGIRGQGVRLRQRRHRPAELHQAGG